MIIKKVAIGNHEESYIEESFSSGFNIISSDDNNKGKTIVIQSMMYALGNAPTFPSSFNYKNYMFVVEFEVDNILYKLYRKRDTFVLKYEKIFMVFDSVSEFKRYWSKHITKLPEIYKNEFLKIVDPELFYQIFFIGQDKKDTSNISNKGYYNKKDFISMIFAMCGNTVSELSIDEITTMKDKIKELKLEKAELLKQHKILKSEEKAVNYLSSVSDKISFEKKIKSIDKINDRILELRKERNRAANRKSKWDSTIKELRSLNRDIKVGELRCSDCNSTNITYISADKSSYAFDVSTVEMRNEILSSINEKIAIYIEELEKYDALISLEQDKLSKTLTESDITLENILAYKDDVFSASDAEEKIQSIDAEVIGLKNQLLVNDEHMMDTINSQQDTMNNIITIMKDTYKAIDPTSNVEIDELFTKKDEVYSGSESTIFHITKLYALQNVIKHNYPIVIDSFRAEDLSSGKERTVIELFSHLNNQKIFTTTVKLEEIGKYDGYEGINHIDYLNYRPSKLLGKSHNDEFKKIISEMSLVM